MSNAMKTNITNYLSPNLPGAPTQAELARMLNPPVTAGAIAHWTHGRKKPNKWIMSQVLEILGRPWGRVLEEVEVWPHD